jgi:hypothetical protein
VKLDELGQKHGTDKASQGHNYLVEYEPLLQPYRSKSDLLVLEIGVREGASVRLWHDYFSTAQIVGVDILERCTAHAGDRISIEIGDQSDEEFLQRLTVKYEPDIIFDDGSHFWTHQIDTFRILFPAMKPGGTFVCEDLHTSRSKWVGKYGTPYTMSAAAYFGWLAAIFSAEGHVYGTMMDAELREIARLVEWIRFGRSFVAIKKKA